MRSARKPQRTGGTGSTPGEAGSRIELLRPTPGLRKLLEEIFDGCREGLRKEVGDAEYQRRRYDFVFHMTDWLRDLKELNELYEHPEKADPDKACCEVIGILYHVIPHLSAAGRLLLDEIPNPFAEPQTMPRPEARNAEPKARKRERKPRTKAG